MNLRQSQAPKHNVIPLRRVSIACTELKPLVIVYHYCAHDTISHYSNNSHRCEITNPTVAQLRTAYKAQLMLNVKANIVQAQIRQSNEKAHAQFLAERQGAVV